MCHNRVIFKQLLQAGAIDYCQIDACRMGGVNEILSVYLMAKKFKGEAKTCMERRRESARKKLVKA